MAIISEGNMGTAGAEGVIITTTSKGVAMTISIKGVVKAGGTNKNYLI